MTVKHTFDKDNGRIIIFGNIRRMEVGLSMREQNTAWSNNF